jgi:5-formyltetrahydrofolate cyclo-ligase
MILMNKKEFRQQQMQKLGQITATTKLNKETQVQAHFLAQPAVKAAQSVAITLSHGFELATMPIIEQLKNVGKSVYIPRTLPEHQMEFVKWTPELKLEPKFFGILEPQGGEVIDASQLDVIVVPGLAYERTQGYRLGFGGGYYDRYLKQTSATKIVLAFEEQVYSKAQWTIEEFDVAMDQIITENGIQFAKAMEK